VGFDRLSPTLRQAQGERNANPFGLSLSKACAVHGPGYSSTASPFNDRSTVSRVSVGANASMNE